MSEIKEIPKGWVIERLGDFVIYQKGKKPKNVSNTKTEKCSIPYVNIKAFEKNIIDEFTDGVGCIFCEDGDLLMVWDGARSGYIGKAIKGALGSTLVKITFPGIVLNYAYYYLLSKYMQINTKAKGTGIPHVDPDLLWNYLFPLPPFPEQHRIVAKIEELFSSLDKGIESLKTAQEQLKVYRQAVLKWAFEGKLTNKNVKEGELPEGWMRKTISEVAAINPSLPNKENIDRNLEVQFLPMKLVEEIVNKIHLIDTRKLADVLKGSYTPFIDEDIIFAKVTPCMENGKIAIVNNLKNGIGFGSSEFHVLRCSNKVLNRYLHRFIVQDIFRNQAKQAMTGAVGLRRVPKQFIENYSIPLPPTLSEQQHIVSEIESRLSVCDKIEETIITSLQQAETLRQSILKKAFEGKLVEQDPNDEPASVLLERIKAEKETLRLAQNKNKPAKKVK